MLTRFALPHPQGIRSSERAAFAVLVAGMVVLGLVGVWVGCPPLRAMPWDVTIQLDGGWRILRGQVPHRDFYNPIGPLYILLVALGMRVGSPSASSIAYGNVLLMVLVVPWAWRIARRRLSVVLAVLFGLFMAVLLVAPRPLGGEYRNTGYAMIYNRQAFVLLSMLLLEWYIEPQEGRGRRRLEGLSWGILFGLLLYAKISYFGMAALLLAAGVVLVRRPVRWYAAGALGVALVVVGMWVLFGINVLYVIRDAGLAAHPKLFSARLTMLGRVSSANLADVYLVFVPLIVPWLARPRVDWRERINAGLLRAWLTTTLIVIAGLVICATNTQLTEIPVLFVAGLVALEYLRRERECVEEAARPALSLGYRFGLLMIVPLCCGATLVRDLGSLAYAAAWNGLARPGFNRAGQIEAVGFCDFIVPPWTTSGVLNEGISAAEYPAKINDGLRLLRRHANESSHVMAMDFSNPFTYALGLTPPKGDALFWAIGYSFNPKWFPEAERTFRDVTIVMVPRVPSTVGEAPTSQFMMAIYGDYLKAHFEKAEETQYWAIWLRQASTRG